MKNIIIWFYGATAYLTGFFALLLFIAFTVDLFLPNTVDRQGEYLGIVAWIINISLIALFGLQHSVMARQNFKQWLATIIPPALERSTFLIGSAVPIMLLVVYWQPIPGEVWSVSNSIGVIMLYTLSAIGWGLVLLSTFLINHFDLFGLRQVYFYTRGETYQPVPFSEPSLYKVVRHPMQLGVLVGVWAIPAMTVSHLLLATGMSLYVLVGLYFEERDLVNAFGQKYREYQHQVPKLIPSIFKN